MNVELLRTTFKTITPRADEVAKSFYAKMLGTFPQVRPLFAKTDFEAQRRNLIQSLALVVKMVDKPDELLPVLEKMGRSHNEYRVEPNMYPYVCYSLLFTLAEAFGDDWTEEAATTWQAALEFVSQKMIEAQQAVTN